VLLSVSKFKSGSAGCCICLQDAMPLAPYCIIVMPLASVDVFNPESAQSFWQLSVLLVSMFWWQATKQARWACRHVSILSVLGISCTSILLVSVCGAVAEDPSRHRLPQVGHMMLLLMQKRKEKTIPFGVNLMRSQVLYRDAQGLRVHWHAHRHAKCNHCFSHPSRLANTAVILNQVHMC